MIRSSVAALLLLAALPAGGQAGDPLWLQAVGASARSGQWTPGAAIISLEIGTEQGKVLDSWRNEYRLAPGGAGGPAVTLLGSVHNGVDVTREQRQAQEKREASGRSSGASSVIPALDNPFDPALQASAVVERLAEPRTVAGRPCAGYRFSVGKKDGGRIEGTAWVDEAAGLPVEASWTPTPMPRGASSLTTTVRYGGPSGEALPGEIVIEGAGGWLMFRRTFRSVITLDSWWRGD